MLRRQIVENMPGPLCPLFEELYLIDGQQEGLILFRFDHFTHMPAIDRSLPDCGSTAAGRPQEGVCEAGGEVGACSMLVCLCIYMPAIDRSLS